MSADDNVFVARARASLEQRLEQTPTHIRSRLNAARHRALDSHQRDTRPAWLPALATAALVVLAVSGVWFSRTPEPATPAAVRLAQPAGDFEMLMQGDDLTLYDNIDFYRWLDKRGMNAG